MISLFETRRSEVPRNNNPVSSVKDVRIQFGFLVTKVINQLEINGFTLDDVVSELDTMMNLDSPEYLDDDGLKLTDIDDFFDFLRTRGYMLFYSLRMLEKVVDSFAKECQQALNDYKDGCLKPFLFKCLPKIEEECFEHEKVAGQVNLVITIDREWDTTTMLDVLELTKNVAAIINTVPHEHLVIDTVRPGSVIVESHIPHRVYSLTRSQQHELKELSVKKLVCDGHELLLNDFLKPQVEHNVANVLYSNQRTPEQHKRQLTERVQRELLAIPERKQQDIRFTAVKLAADTSTLEEDMEAYLNRPGKTANNSFHGFLQFVFERVNWADPKSVLRLKQFLTLLQANTKFDLMQEIDLVGDLVENLKPPSVVTQRQIDNVQVFTSTFPEHDGHMPRHDLSPTMPLQNEQTTSAVMISSEAQLEDSVRPNESLQEAMPVPSLNPLLELSITSNYDGAMIWKISELSQKLHDAMVGKELSLSSLPFCTGRYGYKMCLRAYLNGVGMGQNSHMSLFFVIMRGEFDALLKWPFTHKVTFALVDQNHRKHIVQTFKPNPDSASSSFQRPKSDMNVASGCPQFAPLAVLNDDSYVKDDTIYVKCIVDTSNISHP